jgi:hypothetical protein
LREEKKKKKVLDFWPSERGASLEDEGCKVRTDVKVFIAGEVDGSV